MYDQSSGDTRFPFPDMRLSPEFRALHTEAHRRYPDQVQPPFLTWHIVTSLTDRFDSDRSAASPLAANRQAAFEASAARRQSEIDQVNAFIVSVTGDHNRVVELASPGGDGVKLPFITRDVITSEGTSFNPSIVFRCEYHYEYVTYCFFLPIRHALEDMRDRSSVAPETSQAAAISTRSFNLTDKRVDAIAADVFEKTVLNESERDDALGFRARTALEWDRLFDEAWQTAFRDAPELLHPKIPGRVLGNFRGIVLPRIWMANAYGAREAEIHQFEWRGHQDRFIPTDITDEPNITGEETPHHHIDEHDRPNTPRRWNRVSAGRCLRDNYGLRHALHWPGGKVDDPESKDPLARRRTVANLVLNGRALYASALAPPLPVTGMSQEVADNSSLNKSASRYCIFYCEEHAGRAQDGISARLDRLILRLHNLANNRLMALRGIDRAPYLNQSLDWLDRRLSQLEAEASTPQSLKIDDIKALYRELTDATSSDEIPGGVSFRAAQSKHYTSTFKRLIPSLHIHRIEGWEPYDMFASRKLFNMFDNITGLGDRAEGLKRRLDRIVEIAQLETNLNLARQNTRTSKFTLALTIFIGLLTVITTIEAARGLFDGRSAATGIAETLEVNAPTVSD